MSKVLPIYSWDTSNPKLWLFQLTSPTQLRHKYWSGSAWVTGDIPASAIAVAAGAELTGRYVSDAEWHVFAPTGDGRTVHWFWDATAKPLPKARVEIQ